MTPEVNLTMGNTALIETYYLSVNLLATIGWEKLTEAGWQQDLDEVVTKARNVVAQTMDETPDGELSRQSDFVSIC